MIWVVRNLKWIAVAGIVAIFFGAMIKYGSSRYDAGVRNTTKTFIEADQKGAKNVHETARETLDSIGDAVDVDELLSETGGLRDD